MITKYKISVVTATLNSSLTIERLIESLRKQSDTEFEWVVADGGSSDATLDIVKNNSSGLFVKVISGEDFGIYDGINKAIKATGSEFYIVVGSDDVLHEDAIRNFKENISDEIDIITSSDSSLTFINRFLNLFDLTSPMRKYIYGHSVYTCFRKSLHESYGYYSKRFPIAADLLFIRNCVVNGVVIKKCNFKPGDFGVEGVSNTDTIGVLTETLRVQSETGVNEVAALIIFISRYILFKTKVVCRNVFFAR